MTPKLLKLSFASGEDLARTSDIMTDNLDAFGLSMKDADRLMDVMAATANNTNTSIGMLGEAYTYAAAASRGFDSFEEVNVMLGILANNGIKGAKAGRNLAGVYTRLSKPTKEMKEEMTKTNTKLYDTKGKFKGLRKIIMESKESLIRMTDVQRNQWLATVVGTEGLKIWNSIMNYSQEGMDKVTKSVYESKGTVEKINKEMENTPQNKIKALESAWEGLKLQIADGAAPAITDAIIEITRKINDLSSSGALSKEKVSEYFKQIEAGTKILIAGATAFAGYKLGALALAHPLIAFSTAMLIGGKKAWDDSDKNMKNVSPYKKELIEETKQKYQNPMAVQNALYGESAGLRNSKPNTKYRDKNTDVFDISPKNTDTLKDPVKRMELIRQYTKPKLPKHVVDRLSTYNEREAYMKKQLEISMNVDISGTVVKQDVDVDKITTDAAKQIQFKLANSLKTQMGLQS